MSSGDSFEPEVYRECIEIQRIGNRAVRKARAESLRRGVPNVYSHNGSLYYENTNYEIVLEDPYDMPQ